MLFFQITLFIDPDIFLTITKSNIREIKHRVYSKCERQNYHVIMSFPPFFMFAICRFQREKACSRVHQQREYFFKVLIRSATFISLCLIPVMFHLFFYAN